MREVEHAPPLMLPCQFVIAKMWGMRGEPLDLWTRYKRSAFTFCLEYKKRTNELSISLATLTAISAKRNWLILLSKSLTNRSNTSTRYGCVCGWSRNWNSFWVNWCHSLVSPLDNICSQAWLESKTHLRVYNNLKDSKNGWSSGGVADSAVAIKSSSTSFCGCVWDICAS